MTHSELVNLILGCHTSIFVAASAAYYKYGDRTELFNRSLQGTDSAFGRIRQRITVELADALKPIFENPGSVPTPIFAPSGESYIERAVNPVGSELYKEAIRDFLENSGDAIADYRSLLLARRGWCFWARFLSWSLLGLLVLEILLLASIGLLDKVCEVMAHSKKSATQHRKNRPLSNDGFLAMEASFLCVRRGSSSFVFAWCSVHDVSGDSRPFRRGSNPGSISANGTRGAVFGWQCRPSSSWTREAAPGPSLLPGAAGDDVSASVPRNRLPDPRRFVL